MSIDVGALGPAILRPSPRPMSATHFVQLYEDDAALVDSVRVFLTGGFERGAAAVVIADRAHRERFAEALAAGGSDMPDLIRSGRYISIDADELLSRFMVDGMPDRSLFAAEIGAVLADAARVGTEVRAFGEMVALLWERGNVAAAIALEELWNDLTETHDFKLFCAYPSDGFDASSLGSLHQICSKHSHVIPPR